MATLAASCKYVSITGAVAMFEVPGLQAPFSQDVDEGPNGILFQTVIRVSMPILGEPTRRGRCRDWPLRIIQKSRWSTPRFQAVTKCSLILVRFGTGGTSIVLDAWSHFLADPTSPNLVLAVFFVRSRALPTTHEHGVTHHASRRLRLFEMTSEDRGISHLTRFKCEPGCCA